MASSAKATGLPGWCWANSPAVVRAAATSPFNRKRRHFVANRHARDGVFSRSRSTCVRHAQLVSLEHAVDLLKFRLEIGTTEFDFLAGAARAERIGVDRHESIPSRGRRKTAPPLARGQRTRRFHASASRSSCVRNTETGILPYPGLIGERPSAQGRGRTLCQAEVLPCWLHNHPAAPRRAPLTSAQPLRSPAVPTLS